MVEWIAFLQLEPFEDDRGDIRSTWHTANLMNCLTDDEFEIDEDVIESLTPLYWVETEAEQETQTVTQRAEDLQQMILMNFAN